MPERGKYVVIEGNDGTGKSTQVELLAEWLKEEKNIDSFIAHEPAGTPMADAIRTVIKDGSLPRDAFTDVLLFTAARHEIWARARQELALGRWVLSARNYLSTEAYQGHGDGVELDMIRDMTRQYVGEDYFNPDHTFILALTDEAERKQRITGRGELETPDTFEMRDQAFQDKVNAAYLQIANDHDITPIDAAQSIDIIQQHIRSNLTF